MGTALAATQRDFTHASAIGARPKSKVERKVQIVQRPTQMQKLKKGTPSSRPTRRPTRTRTKTKRPSKSPRATFSPSKTLSATTTHPSIFGEISMAPTVSYTKKRSPRSSSYPTRDSSTMMPSEPFTYYTYEPTFLDGTVEPTSTPTRVQPSVSNASVAPSTRKEFPPTTKQPVFSASPTRIKVAPSTKPILVASPTSQPSTRPSTKKTTSPTWQPSSAPSTKKPASPTSQPSTAPITKKPAYPTRKPSTAPITKKPAYPTRQPSTAPITKKPVYPTRKPSTAPITKKPVYPTRQPSTAPITKKPASPTRKPSTAPITKKPVYPTRQPSTAPLTKKPASPTKQPSTVRLTKKPTRQPSTAPITKKPAFPTRQPSTIRLTKKPTRQPSTVPITKKPASPTRQPSTAPITKMPAYPTRQPSTVRLTTKPILVVLPTSQPNHPPRSTFPTKTPSKSPISVPSLSKFTSTIRLDLLMATVTNRNLVHRDTNYNDRALIVVLNEGDLINILQLVLNITYQVKFPLYQEVSTSLLQISQGTINNALAVSYRVDCELKFTTTDASLLPSLKEVNDISLSAMNDPNYLIFYQFSHDPVLSSVIGTNATFLDETNAVTQPTVNAPPHGLKPVSTWTFTVIASAVAASALLVIVILFVMRRRARQPVKPRNNHLDNSLTHSHVRAFHGIMDHPSETNSIRTDDAQVLMPTDSSVSNQSVEFSLVCKSDIGYDAMSIMSATSDVKLGSIMDVSFDNSSIEGANLSKSRSFSKVWNSDVESSRSIDPDFSKTNYQDDSDDGGSLSYLHIHYGKPSFTLELMGSLDRPKVVDDYSQSEVDLVSSSGHYLNESQSIRSSLYDEHDCHSELSSIQ